MNFLIISKDIKCWFSKTAEQKDSLFRKLLTDRKSTPCVVQSKCGKFEVPRRQRLAKKKQVNARDIMPKGLKQNFELYLTHLISRFSKKCTNYRRKNK